MKVLLVDDHPVMRLGIRIMLQGLESVEVISEASEAKEALELAESSSPDLVILDPELYGEAGDLKVCRKLKSLENPPRVLIYSAHSSREEVAEASLAGADSYLCKRLRREWLTEVVERTGQGQRMWLLCDEEGGFESEIKNRLEEAELTARQKEIANLAMHRLSNEEIAAELHVSLNTVKTHIKNILRELDLGSRQELFRHNGSH